MHGLSCVSAESPDHHVVSPLTFTTKLSLFELQDLSTAHSYTVPLLCLPSWILVLHTYLVVSQRFQELSEAPP